VSINKISLVIYSKKIRETRFQSSLQTKVKALVILTWNLRRCYTFWLRKKTISFYR